MTEQSATRRELEAKVRSMLPDAGSLPSLDGSQKPTLAAIGVGGVLSGYLWGRIRGRRVRKARER